MSPADITGFVVAVGEDELITRHVLSVVADLASARGSVVVHLVHVLDAMPGAEWALRNDAWDYPGAAVLRERGLEHLEEAERETRAALPNAEIVNHLEVGTPSERLVAVAKEVQARYVVIGPFDKSMLQRAVFGSTAEAVLRKSPCSVLVARTP